MKISLPWSGFFTLVWFSFNVFFTVSGLIMLLTKILNLAEYLCDAMKNGMEQSLSPEIASDVLWFLQCWSSSYLYLDDKDDTVIPDLFKSSFGGSTPCGTFLVGITLDIAETNLLHMQAEPAVALDSVQVFLKIFLKDSRCVCMNSRLTIICSFDRSFVCSFVRSLVPSFFCSFTRSLVRLFVCSYICSFARLFLRLFVCSFVRSFVCSFALSFLSLFDSSFVCSFYRLFICSFISSFICSFICSFVSLFSCYLFCFLCYLFIRSLLLFLD